MMKCFKKESETKNKAFFYFFSRNNIDVDKNETELFPNAATWNQAHPRTQMASSYLSFPRTKKKERVGMRKRGYRSASAKPMKSGQWWDPTAATGNPGGRRRRSLRGSSSPLPPSKNKSKSSSHPRDKRPNRGWLLLHNGRINNCNAGGTWKGAGGDRERTAARTRVVMCDYILGYRIGQVGLLSRRKFQPFLRFILPYKYMIYIPLYYLPPTFVHRHSASKSKPCASFSSVFIRIKSLLSRTLAQVAKGWLRLAAEDWNSTIARQRQLGVRISDTDLFISHILLSTACGLHVEHIEWERERRGVLLLVLPALV